MCHSSQAGAVADENGGGNQQDLLLEIQRLNRQGKFTRINLNQNFRRKKSIFANIPYH